MHTGFCWGDLKERHHLKDERIILKWIFKNWVGESWTELIWLRSGGGGGERWGIRNEPLVSIKGEEFLD